jgi:folate-binding protein YgfZ
MLELFRALFGAAAAWREWPGRGLLRVTGGDRVRFLNGMLSADVAALRPGQVASALQLDRKGHLQAEVEVIALEREIWLDLPGESEAALAAVLERHIIADDVKLESLTGTRSLLSIEGPGAAQTGGLAGPDLLWLPGGMLVPEGIRVLGPPPAVAELRARIGLPEIGDAAAEILRIAAGRPRLGVDTNERSFPQEARLERRAVSFEKGCYIGQEIVARIQSRGGVNRLLVRLSADAEVTPGDEISAGGRSTGRVTSAALSPLTGPIALGYVRPDDAVPGTPVRIGSTAGVVLEI